MSKQILMGITACLFVQVVHMNTHAEDWESAVQAGPQEKQIYERPIQTQNTWERSETNLIWNFHNMYQPCIVETPATDYPYLMWFFGWSTTDTNPGVPGCDAIYHARSKDLVSWEIWCGNNSWDTNMQPATWAPVLTASNRFYDEWHNGDPSVVLMDGMFYMTPATKKALTTSMVCCFALWAPHQRTAYTGKRHRRPCLLKTKTHEQPQQPIPSPVIFTDPHSCAMKENGDCGSITGIIPPGCAWAMPKIPTLLMRRMALRSPTIYRNSH